MSKRIASAWSQLLLIWASCNPAMTTMGVQGVAVVASRGTSTNPGHTAGDRPLNILFLTVAKTELAPAHSGMKWLPQQRDGDGKKKYNVAYLFAAAQLLAGDGSGVVFTEMSAEENGWLLPSQGNQEGAGVHPLDAQDVPENMPALGDHESLAKIVDSQNTDKNSPIARAGLRIAYKQFDHGGGDRITQEMQPAASELKELKSAGVHLIPYRLLGGPTEAFPFLNAKVYAEYVKSVVFKKEKVDLVVFDMLAARTDGDNPFWNSGQDLLKDFFPLLEAKSFVRWAGNQTVIAHKINEISEAGAASGGDGDNDSSKNDIIPKGPVLTATFLPKLLEWGQIGAGAQLRRLPGKHVGSKQFPLYFLGENAEGKSVNVGPIGLVMQHPAAAMTSDAHQGGGGKKFAQINQTAPPAATKNEDATVQKIRDRLARGGGGLDGLIYVAFGQQGNGFSKEGIRYLVRELVAASPSSIMYFVRPKMLPDEAQGADAFFHSLPHEDIAQGRLLVHETERAPQLKIFEAFAPKFGRFNADESLKFSFLTHGGSGSLSEALGLSVPVLCLPLFQGDQPDNCETVGRDGLGRDLGKVAMLMTLQGLMEPVYHPTRALTLADVFRTMGKQAVMIATPGHKLTGENGQLVADRTAELPQDSSLEEDLGPAQAELLRRFYQHAEDFRGPAAQKGAAEAEAFKGREMDAAFMAEKAKEWRALAAEKFGEKFTQSSGSSGFSGLAAGVLQAEAALLNGPGPTKMRSAVLRAIRANMTAEKLGNTLSRDADVGPLLAQFAEMKNPTAGAGGDPDGWFKIAEVGAGGRVEPTETEVRSESEEAGNASGLPGWAIALIVVGSVLVVAALLVTLLCCCCCCRG
eukprot:CAMPEP_0179008092 /NCGR_PEP_ID=MMETSP0795-20121207/15517_1 /TAXON_ID=88552 /ORGANISM="Amoebophrya sp., Strain Ameob2" /LENGTH=860 /DNA_ID=CAMNT_0020703125 /DNA_START=144 /DNA_END=2726 /DNA_ORIENTATION=+